MKKSETIELKSTLEETEQMNHVDKRSWTENQDETSHV